MKLELQYFGHLMWRADSLEKTLKLGKNEGRRRRGWQRMRWLNGVTDSRDLSMSKLSEMVKDRKACHATVNGVTNSWTRLSDRTEQNSFPSLGFQDLFLCHCNKSYFVSWHLGLPYQSELVLVTLLSVAWGS